MVDSHLLFVRISSIVRNNVILYVWQREVWTVGKHGRNELSHFKISCGPSSFGEEGVVTLSTVGVHAEERTRSYSIRTITFADTFALRRDDLSNLLVEYEEVRESLREHAMRFAWKWIFHLLLRAHLRYPEELYVNTHARGQVHTYSA